MKVGKKIREARLAKRLTQEQLGNLVGLTKSAIAKYESGYIVNIKRSNLMKLADALDLRGSDLIIDDDPIQAAELSARILLDNELMAALELYYTLDEEEKSIVRRLIYTISKKTL